MADVRRDGEGDFEPESELPETKEVLYIYYFAGPVYGIICPKKLRHCWTVIDEFIIVASCYLTSRGFPPAINPEKQRLVKPWLGRSLECTVR